MINCFILDDEEHFIELLTDYIQQTPSLQLIGSSQDPIKALDLIRTNPPDLLFLDISMPKLDGLSLIKIISNTIHTRVILSTAHAQYALEGYENDVIDYLLKPFNYARFLKAIQKALPLFEQRTVTNNNFTTGNFIFVRTEQRGHQRKIEFDEVLCIESQRNYAIIHCANEQIRTLTSLKELEDTLPASRFFRIHQSYIIQVSQVKSIENGTAILKNNTQIPIGGKYKDEFIARLGLRE